MCWRIFIILRKRIPLLENTMVSFWNDEISFIVWHNGLLWFHCSSFSKVAKIIYNSILDVCSIVVVHNLTVQWLKVDQKLCGNFTKTCPSHLSQWPYGIDLALSSSYMRALHNCPNGRKVQNYVFLTPIYKFYIYFFKMKEFEAVRRNILTW